jgi:hypothetical protein
LRQLYASCQLKKTDRIKDDTWLMGKSVLE